MNSASIVVFAALISCAFAAMAIGPAQVDPAQPGKCHDADTNNFYAPGESWPLEYCGRSTCSLLNISGTPQLMVEYASCGVAMVDPPCYLKEDKTKQYPDCCPQLECPEDYSNEQQVIAQEHHQEQDDDEDFLNEIEDDEDGDSAYNHKYNNKMVEEQVVQDPSRVTKEEYTVFHKQFGSAVPTNVNKYESSDKKNGNDRHAQYRNIPGQDQFTDLEESTLQQRNAAYLKALQDEIMRYYPSLRRASPRFDYISSEEFKDDQFQLF